MLRTTLLSILAISLPVVFAGEPYAVTYWTFSRLNCVQGARDFWIPDGKCENLPGKRMTISEIADTCRST